MVPVIVFAYNRPDKLREVLVAIKKQTRTPDRVIGIVDGPRCHSDESLCRACQRDLATVADEIIVRPTNLGCAANIMAGTNEISGRYSSFVVLEDDTVPAATWYEAMLALLQKYEHDDHIWAVGAYPSVLNGALDDYKHDVILSPRFSCWGWGCWSRKWTIPFTEWYGYRNQSRLPWDPHTLPGHAGPDIGNMIVNHPHGQLWDGIVAGSFLFHGALQAIPRYYLVHNIGAGAHVSADKIRFMVTNNPIQERIPQTFPPQSDLDQRVSRAICDYVRAMS